MAKELNISRAREELGLSQAELADLIGVDQSTISFWETGKHKPRGPAKRLIARLIADHRTAARSAAA